LVTDALIILDGALATELERRGADLRDPLWSAKLLIENPALIRQVHLDYLYAGAQIITSASYQASFSGFARRGLDQAAAARLMRLSVELADEARTLYRQATKDESPLLVAAAIGPYGAVLHDGSEYRGGYGLSRQRLIDFHRPRLEALAHSGADLLACETLPCPLEAEALVRLLANYPNVYAWLSFSCKDGAHVCEGQPFAECVAIANQCDQIVAVGVNCSAPHFVEDLLLAARTATDKPLLAYPNSGEGWDAANQCWLTAERGYDFVALASRWHEAGARLIGGCCRTTPEEIRRLAAWKRRTMFQTSSL
jgi:homocysteine S-methyltransferase